MSKTKKSIFLIPRKLSQLDQFKKRETSTKRSLNTNITDVSANLQKQLSLDINPEKTQKKLKQQFSNLGGKLPLIKIKKILKKIGAGQKNQQIFVPSQYDQANFRKQKWKQLKQRYAVKKTNPLPFEHQLDPIVLDCWHYRQNFGRKTVWKKYRENFDDLTFDTLKAIKKKY